MTNKKADDGPCTEAVGDNDEKPDLDVNETDADFSAEETNAKEAPTT